MRNLSRSFLLMAATFVAALFLSGCADLSTQFTKMAEAQGGERARLRVVANQLVKGIPGKDCVDWSSPGAGTIFGGIVGSSGYRSRSLNMPQGQYRMDSSNFGEMYLEAGKPFTLVLITTPESRVSCSIAGTFIPEANKDYEAGVHVDVRNRRCSMHLYELGEPNKEIAIQEAKRCK